MVSTPPLKANTHNDSNDKVNIMSPYQDFSQYIDSSSPQVKSGDYDDYFYDILTGNDIFHAEHQSYEISPELNSSMTTPSLILDGISTPRDLNDSPIFNHYAASPALDPALGFFPDLTDPTVVAAARRSLMQISSIPPSLTIPVDDTSSLPTIQDSSVVSPTLSPALNIPWNSETAGSSTDDLLQNMSSLSPLSPHTSTFSDNNTANNSPKSTSTAISSTSNISPTTNKLNTRSRKRSNEETERNPQVVADELAVKRAKNTDAARRSRLRRVMKMEALEKQVASLKNENNDLQTRIAVLESEKKGLEDKYAEKDSRVNMLEQQLSEAHERLIKRT